MKQEELTKTFVIQYFILKKTTLGLGGLYTNISAL